MDGIDIQSIVRSAVEEYIATRPADRNVRALARVMAKRALERALASIDDAESE